MNFEQSWRAPREDRAQSLACPRRGEGPDHHAARHHFSPEIKRGLKRLTIVTCGPGLRAFGENCIFITMGMLAVLTGVAAIDEGWGLALCLLGWIVIGARMRGLATLLHESSHQALARPLWLNAGLGCISGWAILQVRGSYIRSHVHEHHRHLGDPDLDPDTQQYLRQGLLRADPATFILSNLAQLLFGLKTFVNLPYLLRDRLVPRPTVTLTTGEKVELVGFTIFWIALITLLAATGNLTNFVLLWMVPYLTTFQAINWLIELSEHFPLIWTRSNPLEQTRNRKGPPIENFLFGCHGEGWHRVHHKWPGIPFWNLEAAHLLMMQDPIYAALEAETGGLFFPGPNGASSIITSITRELAQLRAQALALEAHA